MVSSHLLLCALVRLRLTLIIVAQQYIASLEDIIASKKAVGRPKDLAVIEELELTLDEQKRNKKDLVVENVHEAALRARIRALLSLPMNKRTNFLRTRLPSGGSCI